MAPKTAVAEALSEVEETADEVAAPEAEQAPVVTVVTAQPSSKNVRVKGTWTMYWGTTVWDFVDGQRYDLPVDLFEYLKSYSNIYDTI